MTKARGLLVLMTALALGGCDITATGPNDGNGMLAGAFSGSGPATASGNPAERATAAATATALNGLIGSGIGSAAIQLAKRMGCTVITTVGSNGKIEKAKALGADHVINYREDRFEGVVRKLTKKKGVDVVFEHVGADTFAGSMLSLKRGGRLVTCGSTSGVSTQINLMQLFQQQLKLLGSFGCRMENMANAMLKMAAGQVAPVIDTEVGFDGIDTALKRMEGRDVFGKIILKLD